VDRSTIDWRGYIPATVTPFTEDLELDRKGFQEVIEWLVAEGMHGIVVAGSSGEWPSLTGEERVDLFRLAAEQVRGRVPLIGCCNAISPQESRAFARAAEEIGLDGIIVAPPPYSRPNDKEIVAFYEWIARETELPLALYNWPRGTGVDMGPQLIQRLADIDTVVAIKNSTGSLDSFVRTFFSLKDRLRIFGFGTDELSMSLLREHGGDGTIGGGGVLGRDHPDYFNRLWAGEIDRARACGDRDRRFFEFSMHPDFSPKFASAQAIMKEALNVQGVPGGYPRPPYLPLDDVERERVRAFMSELDRVAREA
jgi:dihydrodipicolinate synthase/N-acetylneuraminate lyase